MKKYSILFLFSTFLFSFSSSAQNCQASFQWDAPSFVRVHFTDSSTTTNAIGSRFWDFGDGTTYTPRNLNQVSLNHYYNAGGTYYACLTITDTLNCSSTICDSVTVIGYSSATCMPAYSYTVDSNNTLNITNLTGPDSNYSYQWNYWDSISVIDSSKDLTVNLSAPGMFHFSLNVTNNNNGISCFLNDTIPVNYCEPIIAFSIGQNDSVYFYNWNVHRNFQYTWNFGDSTANANWGSGWHQFPASQNYLVSLTIYDSVSNCTSTVSDSILLGLVNNQRCKAEFSVEKDTTSNFNVFINNLSTKGAQISYTWDFGDGNKAYTRNPSHNYSSFGAYEVCLTIDHWGYRCISTFCDTIEMDSSGNLKAGFGIQVREPLSVGIEEETKENLQNLKIYPNPAQSKISIDMSDIQNLVNLKLIDLSGRILMEREDVVGGSIQTYNIEAFKNGIYFIIVNDGRSQSVKKLIIAN